MNEYFLVEVNSNAEFTVTKCLAREIFDAVMTALDRWRYAQLKSISLFVVDVDNDYTINIKELSVELFLKNAFFARDSKPGDHFDEEKFIRRFIEEECKCTASSQL